MSMRKSRAPFSTSPSSPHLPPAPHRDQGRRSSDHYPSPKKRQQRNSGRGYDMGPERSNKIDLLICVFHGAPSHRWRTAPFTFDRRRADDRELWEDIRYIYRDELQGIWRRILGFKKLKNIKPVEVWNRPRHNCSPRTLEGFPVDLCVGMGVACR